MVLLKIYKFIYNYNMIIITHALDEFVDHAVPGPVGLHTAELAVRRLVNGVVKVQLLRDVP